MCVVVVRSRMPLLVAQKMKSIDYYTTILRDPLILRRSVVSIEFSV